MAFVKLEEKRIEDEHDDDRIAGCVLPASHRGGERWIALLVNFWSTVQNSDRPFASEVIQTD
jgi:hypothetical protein